MPRFNSVDFYQELSFIDVVSAWIYPVVLRLVLSIESNKRKF